MTDRNADLLRHATEIAERRARIARKNQSLVLRTYLGAAFTALREQFKRGPKPSASAPEFPGRSI